MSHPQRKYVNLPFTKSYNFDCKILKFVIGEKSLEKSNSS